MEIFFVTFCYILVAYGACNVIAFGDGPFKIFTNIRSLAHSISPHFGKLFSCMMCLPANFGWICSIFNWFLIPVSFTPFNIIFGYYKELWWLASLCDGAFTTAVVYLIYVINEYIEKRINYYEAITPLTENNVDGFDSMDNNGDILLVEDITINNNDNGK